MKEELQKLLKIKKGKKAFKMCSYLENAPFTPCHTPFIEKRALLLCVNWSPYGYAKFWAQEYRKFNHMYVRKHMQNFATK